MDENLSKSLRGGYRERKLANVPLYVLEAELWEWPLVLLTVIICKMVCILSCIIRNVVYICGNTSLQSLLSFVGSYGLGISRNVMA